MKTANPLLWRLAGLACCLTSSVSFFYLRYVAAALLPLAVLTLAAMGWRAAKPWLHRLAAALVLVFYRPRPSVEPRLYTFCYPDHA